MIAPGEAIPPPPAPDQLDYEAELAIVMKGGRGINKGDALNHVFGYTIVNDVTARDLQKQTRPVVYRQVAGHLLPDGPLGW